MLACVASFSLVLMLVPDIMHEFLLGVWKALFTSLLRLQHTLDKDKLDILDERFIGSVYYTLHLSMLTYYLHRFREISTFNSANIRKFSKKVSDLKSMTASRWEMILKVCVVARTLQRALELKLSQFSVPYL